MSPKCNGCINLNKFDNRGLDVPINALEGIYKPNGQDSDHSLAMSRADFWSEGPMGLVNRLSIHGFIY